MADLKINQLDPIIPVSAGSGANYSALSDADMFIVKMKVRGTAIGDEDRKLTWLELRNSLNLSQYMGTVGGQFTGDITLNNNKAVKGSQTGSGSDISMLFVDTANRVNVGTPTNLTRIMSSGVPEFMDGSGSYNFITSKNLPSPGDLSGGGAYTKAQVDAADSLKFDKTGGDISGDVTLSQNNNHLYGRTSSSLKISLATVSSGDTVDLGDTNLHTNILSTDVPKWVKSGTQSYDIITRSNLPTPGDINAFTKTEVNTALAKKLDLTGGTMTGILSFGPNAYFTMRDASGINRGAISSFNGNLQIGEAGAFTIKMKSNQNPTVALGTNSTEYQIYHQGNKPTVADLGLTDTVSKADSALQDGAFGLGTVPNHVPDSSFLTVTDKTQFFVQDGGSTEQRFGNLGAGVHIYYGAVGTGTSTQYRSASLFVGQDNKLVSKWSSLDYTGKLVSTQTATYFSDQNPPTAAQLGGGGNNGAFTKNESDNRYARSGVNADITALNGLTGSLKVGANATQPLEVTTLQQVQALTSGTAGAVVGVVGGFIGAVQWFNGPRASIPSGYVAADGQLLNRTDYPDLWSAANAGALAITESDEIWITASNGSNMNRGFYSPGNSPTTFRVPDLNGVQSGSVKSVFLRGSSGAAAEVIGRILPDSAPNITGSISTGYASNVTIIERVSGAFYGSGAKNRKLLNPTTLPQDSTTDDRYQDAAFNASKSSASYGRDSTGEVHPAQAYGVWIIRASNNFEAANTTFTVYNGATSLPASGTQTNAGSLNSVYSVGGVQDHSVSLASSRVVGQGSSAKLTVVQQAQGSLPFKSYTYDFNTDGTMSANTVNVNALNVAGSVKSSGVGVFNTLSEGLRIVSAAGNSNYIAGRTADVSDVDSRRWLLGNTGGTQGVTWINAPIGNNIVLQDNNSIYYNAASSGRHAFNGTVTALGNFQSISNIYVGTNTDSQGNHTIDNTTGRLNTDGNVGGTVFGSTSSASKYVTQWVAANYAPKTSDERIKANIQDIDSDDAQQFIAAIRPVTFTRTNVDEPVFDSGFIAQEVEEVKPELVTKFRMALDAEGTEWVDDGRSLASIMGYMVKEMQNMRKEIEALKAAQK